MGKEIRITCDCCGKDVYGQEYYTLKPRKVRSGKQYLFCSIWLCKECFDRTKLKAMLFAGDGKE